MLFKRQTLTMCVMFFSMTLVQAFGAATVEVGNCSVYPQYPTIQAAVNGSPAGTLIYVCPGNYPEQVTINKNLTLQGLKITGAPGVSASVVSAPPGGIVTNAASLFNPANHIAAQIYVKSPATSVTINNIMVDGQNSQINACDPDLIGIYFQNASGTVTRSAVVNEVLGAGLDGCQSGQGIYVQSGSGQVSAVNVNTSVVANYEKNGITGNEIGTTLTATDNTVVGRGSTNGAAENGIQIGFGAHGTISNNTVADDIWAPDTISDPGDAAAGILVYAANHVSITSNRVTNTQFGIAVVSDASEGNADSTTISSNTVSATRIFDAIDVCSNLNTVSSNVINGADESGIHLDDTCGNSGKNNTVTNNTVTLACGGILQGNGSGNSLSGNVYYDVVQQKPTGNLCPQVSASIAASFKQAKAVARPGFKPSRL